MSSRRFDADVMLNGIQFLGLGYSPQTVNEWFEAWEEALKRKNFRDLLTLTHFGLQLPLYQGGGQESLTRLFCHYLALADGHQSAKNFGYYGPTNSEAELYTMSNGELLQKLSDKAWTELCNRVFVVSNDGYGEHPKYSHFRQPILAEAFIRFIDPDRWCDDSSYHIERANIDAGSKSAYHAKALAFIRVFLREAWQYQEIMKRENAFLDEPEEEGLEAEPFLNTDKTEAEAKKVSEDLRFFRKLKPTLVRLMVHYGMANFLYDKQLDRPSRRMLRNIAFGNNRLPTPVPDCEKVDLATAYGQLDPERGWLILGYREAARILLLYPHLVRGRREYVREQVRRKQAAKAAKVQQLRTELETVQAKLEALRLT